MNLKPMSLGQKKKKENESNLSNNQKLVKGYKILESDWTCDGIKFSIYKCYEIDRKLNPNSKGFHFYKNLSDCYYTDTFDEMNSKVAEIIAYGETTPDGINYYTDKLEVDNVLAWNDLSYRLSLCGKPISLERKESPVKRNKEENKVDNSNKQDIVKGYKIFESNWSYNNFEYMLGGCYESDEKPIAFQKGHHFYKKLSDCFAYYLLDKEYRVAEITAYGDIDSEEDQYYTNKIKIEKELSWYEVFRMLNLNKSSIDLNSKNNNLRSKTVGPNHNNTGCYNSGCGNSGCYNKGQDNSGNHNYGGFNSGDYNHGDYNSGQYSKGDKNTGYTNNGLGNTGSYNNGAWNTGFWNIGNNNSGSQNCGDFNSGDWNNTNYSNGCFNTIESKMYLFNKLSDWTYSDWIKSEIGVILNSITQSPVVWIKKSKMTDEEKQQYPEYRKTGGYLKVLSKEDIFQQQQKNWNQLTQDQKEKIMSIPNFDKSIFKKITGIDIDL